MARQTPQPHEGRWLGRTTVKEKLAWRTASGRTTKMRHRWTLVRSARNGRRLA